MTPAPTTNAATPWDGLLFDCRLATMEPGSSDGYGIIEAAAIGWKDGELVFVGKQSDLPGPPDALAASVRRAHGA